MQFCDRLTIDRSHRSRDGYLRVTAKAARTGVQDYLGREVDPEGKHFAADQVVKVYRPPEEVFAADSVASFIGRPITDDHPAVPVTAKNWRDLARGVIGGAVRDGEWLRFDLALMDADTVAKVDGGKRELSNGYSADLSIEDGTAPDGTAYQAVQRRIRGNHIALVDRARAGPEARIADGGNKIFADCDFAPVILIADAATETNTMPKFLTLDGLKVDLADAEAVEAAIAKLQRQANDAATKLTAAEAKNVADAATIVAKDAEIADLKAKLADAAITPAKLADAAKEYADVQAKAKALGVSFAEDADTAAIKKAVVDAKMGDKAKDYTADHIDIAFAALTKDATPDAPAPTVQPLGRPVSVADGAAAVSAARAARLDRLETSYRPQAA
ncbi:DUF2213 domain-containing protein [Sphingosinicella ginsenosidimutans]|uniref:DUF2213 domain-containing protein n=1 Tax=Allosphingosinicella ginsenosidimutans TaxID=1176539 RepID=A0A5C6TVG4_9SPHN|nr:DUF2213 domain-containing protein [Sphingosinicella ginsenosidimutans]TXC63688.1 DUF2213 domain-containing protein [Sphingosinicella ginsenosidimutans]